MVNRWMAEEWGSGPNSAHRQLLRDGVSDICTYRPASAKGEAVVDVPNCQAYFDFEEVTANGTSIQVGIDQARVQLLKQTLDDPPVDLIPPRQGSKLIFDDRTVTVVARLDRDEDSWMLICRL